MSVSLLKVPSKIEGGEPWNVLAQEMTSDDATDRAVWDTYVRETGNDGGADRWRFGSLRTYDATIRQLRNGTATTGALKAYDTFRSQMPDPPAPVSIKRRRIYDITGNEPQVERYLIGEPALWERRQRSPHAAKRIVSLGMNCGHNAGEDESAFAETVARCVAVADALETAGYSVRVLGVMASDMTGRIEHESSPHASLPNMIVAPAFVLKEAGEALDCQRLLSYGVPGALRSQGFAHWRRMAQFTKQSGLGSCRADVFELASRQVYGAVPVYDLPGAIEEATTGKLPGQ